MHCIGQMMAEKNISLVYGGGNKGLMGAVANSAMEYGGKVIGVIPKVLLEWEAQHEGITELRVVEDMHVRKRMLYELCDAAVILAGGNGTLDELYEMVTWNNLKIHNKKIILLNTAGFTTTSSLTWIRWRKKVFYMATGAKGSLSAMILKKLSALV
jgi:uncharacterized protein (TIGR00730 family)